MFEISIEALGSWALLTDGRTVRARVIYTVARRALRMALSKFATQSGRNSLMFRFADAAFSELNLVPRSPAYQKAQTRILGRIRPFFSPKRKADHMQFIIRTPGYGHRLQAENNGMESVMVKLLLPGARVLNFTKRAGEFLNLSRGGFGYDADSARWLKAEFQRIFFREMETELNRPRRRKPKVSAA